MIYGILHKATLARKFGAHMMIGTPWPPCPVAVHIPTAILSVDKRR